MINTHFSISNEFGEKVEFNDGIFLSLLEGDERPVLAAKRDWSVQDAFKAALELLGLI